MRGNCGAAWLFAALSGLAIASGQSGPKHSFEVSHTERAILGSGGTIHFEGSYGYLAIEGSDESDVEVAMINGTDHFYQTREEDRAIARAKQVRVVIERQSAKELTIRTILPTHRSRLLPWRTVTTENKTTPQYRVRVPRDSRLFVHHDNGYLWVEGVTGDIDAHCHTGDITVVLRDGSPYSIDAKTGFGSVSSDLSGVGSKPLLVGSHLVLPSASGSRRIRLRMGRGSIAIQKDSSASTGSTLR